MTGRQKIQAALSPGGTDAFAAVICYEGIYVRDHWSQLTALPWWTRFHPDVEQQAAWRRDAFARTGQDWFELPLCPSGAARESLRIEASADGVVLVDRRTGEAEHLKQPMVGGWTAPGRLESVKANRLPETAAELDLLIPPPTGEDPAQAAADGRGDLAARLLEEFGQTLYPIRSVDAPLWRCYGLWGFEGMMTLVADRPDLVEHACGRLLARALHGVRESAALGAAGIWVEDCLTDLVSPEAFARLNVPLLRAITDAIRAAGMKSVYYFCGNPAGKWELLLSVGADALSLEESKKGFTIDIEEVVERAGGRCAVLGNLDAIGLLPSGTEARLRAEIARQLTAGRRSGGRFIMSVGSPVTPGTPVERVRRYCELVHELGSAQGGPSFSGAAGHTDGSCPAKASRAVPQE